MEENTLGYKTMITVYSNELSSRDDNSIEKTLDIAEPYAITILWVLV